MNMWFLYNEYVVLHKQQSKLCDLVYLIFLFKRKYEIYTVEI